MKNAAEFIQLINEAGLSPMEALISATSVNADMLGLGDTIGRLAKGFSADFIIVQGDPVSDPTLLVDPISVRSVYQNGRKVAESGQLII